MKIAKNAVAAMAAAALAASMVCAAPATMAQAAPAQPAAAEAGSTYTTMAKATKARLNIGQKTTLKVKGAKVTSWKSNKASVVSVTKKGVITAKKAGKATVTAKYKGGSAKFVITVVDPQDATLAALKGILTSLPTIPDEDTGADTYVMPSADGTMGIVYRPDDGTFTFTCDIDEVGSFQITVDDTAWPAASFDILIDESHYHSGVEKAKYTKTAELEWNLVTNEETGDEQAVSSADNEALSKFEKQCVYSIGTFLAGELELQMSSLGFYNIGTFK